MTVRKRVEKQEENYKKCSNGKEKGGEFINMKGWIEWFI